MKSSIRVLFSVLSVYGISAVSDAGLDTPGMIENHGYPSETHQIITGDNYILTYHRIPYGIKSNDTSSRPAVLIMHGLQLSSGEDVMLGPKRGLAYLLADAGYDVWLGNARGNQYSRGHTSIDIVAHPKEFFDFSWHEIGYYDLPAAIDYILNLKGDDSLFYVGTSQGSTAYFVLTSTLLEYNNKIRLASLMSPAAFMSHKPETNFLKALCKYIDQVEALLKKYQIYEVPFTDAIRAAAPTVCSNPDTKFVCEVIARLVMGNEKDFEANQDLIPVFLSVLPSNSAMKQYIHYGQQIKSGGFSWFDYGAEGNMDIYDLRKPPQYDLSRISTPTAFYYAKNDGLIPYQDDVSLISSIPNVVKDYLVPDDRYGHDTFGYGYDVVELVYNVILEVMEQYR